MQFLKTSLTGPAKEAISGMGFTAQAYYSAWELLTNRFGKPSVIVQAQLQKLYSHPPVRHDDSFKQVKLHRNEEAPELLDPLQMILRVLFGI